MMPEMPPMQFVDYTILKYKEGQLLWKLPMAQEVQKGALCVLA
jgi:hypothetical protein